MAWGGARSSEAGLAWGGARSSEAGLAWGGARSGRPISARRPGPGPADGRWRPAVKPLLFAQLSVILVRGGVEDTPPARGTALPRQTSAPRRAQGSESTAGPREPRRHDTAERQQMARTATPSTGRVRGEHAAPAVKRPRRPSTATETARAERRAQNESTTDSLQVFLNQASRYALLTGPEEIDAGKAHRARRHRREGSPDQLEPPPRRLPGPPLPGPRPGAWATSSRRARSA